MLDMCACLQLIDFLVLHQKRILQSNVLLEGPADPWKLLVHVKDEET